MAVTVGTETFVVDGQRNYLLMQGNDQYLRRFNFQPSWTTMTLGILYAVPSNAATFVGGILMGFTTSANGAGIGFKQGRGTGVVRGLYGTHGIIGVAWGYSGGGYGTYTYANDPASGSYYTSQFLATGAYSGGILTGTAGSATPFYLPTTESFARKGLMAVQLTRLSATSINLSSYIMVNYTSSNGTNYNYTDNTLISTCQLLTPKVDGVGLNGNTANLSTNDDVNYPLDTVNIFWSGSAVPLRVYQVAVAINR
jgi:hypothetical protein